jgi:hypothetical protein
MVRVPALTLTLTRNLSSDRQESSRTVVRSDDFRLLRGDFWGWGRSVTPPLYTLANLA